MIEDKGQKIPIEQWFDVHNIEHIKAYKYLQDEGVWPIGFIPEYITMTNSWHILLMAKFTVAYLNQYL